MVSRSEQPLKIGLERPPPSTVDPSTGRPTEVYDLGPSGEPIFRAEETDDQKLGTLVRRIWTEKGGIASFTSAGLAVSLAQQAAETAVALEGPVEGDDEAMDGTEEPRAELPTGGEGLDLDGMRAFKTDVWEQLEQAKHALSNFHHILTLLLPATLTLAPSTTATGGATAEPAPNPAYSLPPHIPLPPSSFSTTVVLPKDQEMTEDVRSALLGKKQADVRQTAAQLAREARALDAVVAKNADEWAVALGVKRKGWPMALRNSSAGGPLGGKRDERDWSASYALENAPVALRLRHTAHLPPPSTSSSSQEFQPIASSSKNSSRNKPAGLIYPARTQRRLILTIERTLASDAIERRSSRRSAQAALGGDFTAPAAEKESEGEQADLEEAMREAVDEEIFAEVMAEARQSALMRPSRMTASSVLLDVSPGVALVVSFLPDLAPDASDALFIRDPLATLLLSTLKSQLLNLHAYRLQALHASLLPLRDPSRPALARPRFLGPIVEVLQFDAVERAVRALVVAIKEGAAQWGGEVGIRWEETTRTTTADDDGPSGTSDRRRSKTCLVTFGRAFASSSPSSAAVGPAQLVRLHLISPARIFAVLPPSAETGIAPPAGPRAPVPIADLPHLSALLASVLQACLVRGIVDFVAGLERLSPAATAAAAAAAGSETAPARRSCCFPHDAKSLAVLQWTRGQLLARPTILLPSTSISSDATLPTLTLRLTLHRPPQPPVDLTPVYTSGPAGQGQGTAADWLLAHWQRVVAD